MVPVLVQDGEKLLTLARQTGFRATALSKALKISSRQLRRHTHLLFGCSPQVWLDQQRLRLASPLLKQHRCIKTVTFMLGFKRVSHFSRTFKLHYGISPTAYLQWDDLQNLSPSCALRVSTETGVGVFPFAYGVRSVGEPVPPVAPPGAC